MDKSKRLREERVRIGYSQEAFGAIGGVKLQAQNNYESGKRSPDMEYLSSISTTGADVLYILTGVRQKPVGPASDVQDELLQRGIAWGVGTAQNEVWLSTRGLLCLLNYHDNMANGKKLEWGVDLCNALATDNFADARALNLQAVNLQGNAGGRVYPQLLIYLSRTPPFTPWSISPSEGLKDRYELDAIAHNLPLTFPDTAYLAPVLMLSAEELDAIKKGAVVSLKP